MKLTKKDFDYMKDIIKEDEQEHQKSLIEKNLPDEVIASYEGRIIKATGDSFEFTGNVIEDFLFIAVNTLLPSLFFQVPKAIVTDNPGGSRYSAEVLQGLARHYYNQKHKLDLQNAIMDAYLAYGIGIVKIGYNSRRGKLASEKPSFWTGKTKNKKSAVKEGMEASLEYLKYENAFIERVSPRNVYLDASKEWGKGRHITFKYKRTLQEIMDSNLYNLSSDFIDYFRISSNNDPRRAKLTLKEHWVMKEDGFAWKLVYCDEWQEELQWGKSAYTELPVSMLRFNKPSDTLYPVSHGLLGTNAQKELSYLNKLWKEHIDKTRRQWLVYWDKLTEEGKKTLKANIIDGIVPVTEPITNAMVQQIQGVPMNADVFQNIANVRQYLNLVMSSSGVKVGEQPSKGADLERQKGFGDQLRSSGMIDDIKDFAGEQVRKIVLNVMKFGDPDITIKVTGKNVVDPITGELITGSQLKLGGKDGFTIKDEILGKIEEDYKYSVNMGSAVRPDFAITRKQIQEFALGAAQLEPLAKAQGKVIEWGDVLEQWGSTFPELNLKSTIRDMTDEEKQAQQIAQQQQMQMAMLEKASKGNPSPPTEAALVQGASQV